MTSLLPLTTSTRAGESTGGAGRGPIDGDDLSTGNAPGVLSVPGSVASRAEAQPQSNTRRADCPQRDEYVDHKRCVVKGSTSGRDHGATVAGLEYLRSVGCFLCCWRVACCTRGSGCRRTTTPVLLFLHHTFADDLVHGGLDEGAGDGLSGSVTLPVVGDPVGVGPDVGVGTHCADANVPELTPRRRGRRGHRRPGQPSP